MEEGGILGTLCPFLGSPILFFWGGAHRPPIILGGGPHFVQQPLVVEAVEAQEAIEAAGGDEGQRGVALQAPHAAPHPLQALQQPPWGGGKSPL